MHIFIKRCYKKHDVYIWLKFAPWLMNYKLMFTGSVLWTCFINCTRIWNRVFFHWGNSIFRMLKIAIHLSTHRLNGPHSVVHVCYYFLQLLYLISPKHTHILFLGMIHNAIIIIGSEVFEAVRQAPYPEKCS